MILYHLLGGVNLLLCLLICLVILSCALSWFLPVHHRAVRLVDRIVEPVLLSGARLDFSDLAGAV